MESASPLLLDLLRVPFAKAPRFSRSVDAFDFESANYIGLRVLDVAADIETRERAESAGELLGA